MQVNKVFCILFCTCMSKQTWWYQCPAGSDSGSGAEAAGVWLSGVQPELHEVCGHGRRQPDKPGCHVASGLCPFEAWHYCDSVFRDLVQLSLQAAVWRFCKSRGRWHFCRHLFLCVLVSLVGEQCCFGFHMCVFYFCFHLSYTGSLKFCFVYLVVVVFILLVEYKCYYNERF